mmetsp:Transcript_67084/g.216348  ORF Transcript_67084/g.216348 Transcript_67084/m.216348 type:complete len:771 (-) Transcript_67084:70-2382(-)
MSGGVTDGMELQREPGRAGRLLRKLLPCLDHRRLHEPDDVVGNQSFGLGSEGQSRTATLQLAIVSLRRGLQVLERLEALPVTGDIAREQIRDGLRRLEEIAEAASREPGPTAGPGSDSNAACAAAGKGAPPGGHPASSGEAAAATAGTATATNAHGHAAAAAASTPSAATEHSHNSLKWVEAVEAVKLQQALSMKDGAVAPALNSLVTLLWPRIDEYVGKLVHEQIEPSINASLPSMFQGSVKFTKVSLGASSPCLGPLHVEHLPESGDIELHLGIKFASDLDVELTAVSVPIGISKISLEGAVVCLLAPPLAKPPFFGGVQVFFPNPPEVEINFVGAARVADIPGLRGAVRGAVAGSIADVCVLPRRIAVDLDEEDSVDITDLTFPEPMGVLRFTLWSGSDLVASDVNLFGAATSDPYVVGALGIQSWTSPTVKKTLNPVWGGEDGVTVDFLVHNTCQALSLKVFDYDFGSSDDLIGVAHPMHVSSLYHGKSAKQHEVELHTATTGASAGKLSFSARLLSLTSERPTAQLQGPSVAHLSAKILSASGLSSTAEYPFTVRVRLLAAGDTAGGGQAAGGGHEPSSASEPARGRSENLAQQSSRLSYRSSRSTLLGGSLNRAVLAEGATTASVPQPQQQLAEALGKVCIALADRGTAAPQISEILDVEQRQVEHFLASQQDPAEAEKAARTAALERAATAPTFNHVLQMLLPAVEELGAVEIALLDKRKKSVAAVEVPMLKILGAASMRLEGPFQLSAGVTVLGNLWLKWLV